MPQPKATIHDIARELGISKSAVANALSGTGRFSAETGALVRETAARLGYVSNKAAKSLRTGRLAAYGLHLPAIARELPFYMEFAFGAARGADAAQCDLTLFTGERAPGRSHPVDGAIVVDTRRDEPIVQALLDEGRPVVAVGRYEGAGADRITATIETRHGDSQREILHDLARRGRAAPALLAIDQALTTTWAGDMRRVFEEWCRDAAVTGSVIEIGQELGLPQVAEATASALDAGADVIVCGAQGHATTVRALLAERGVGTDEVEVVTFAASPTELGDPTLTAIALDAAGFGAAAAELLTEVLASPENAPRHRWFDGTRARFGFTPT